MFSLKGLYSIHLNTLNTPTWLFDQESCSRHCHDFRTQSEISSVYQCSTSFNRAPVAMRASWPSDSWFWDLFPFQWKWFHWTCRLSLLKALRRGNRSASQWLFIGDGCVAGLWLRKDDVMMSKHGGKHMSMIENHGQ